MKLFFGFIIYFLFFVANGYAQACFTADKVRGCVPLIVNVSNCSPTPNPTLVAYKYSEAEGFVPRTTNTYTTPGLYSITQIVQIATSGDSIRKTNYIQVLPSPPPIFQIKYCSARQVSVFIPDNTYEQYEINWGDGSPLQIVLRGANAVLHSYLTNAPVSISVTGKYVPGNCGGVNAQIVNPINDLPLPYIKSLNTITRGVSNGKIDMILNTDASFRYEFLINNVSESIINGTGGLITKSFENLNTTNLTYCFSVKVKDNCGNELTSGNYFCNLNLNVTVLDNINKLEWNPYPIANVPANSFQQYIIYRNGQPFKLLNDINTQLFEDNEVVCLINYCYSVVVEFLSPLGTFTSQSNQNCVQAFSTIPPPAPANFNTTVFTDRSIKILWNVPTQPPITAFEIIKNGQSITYTNVSQNLLDSDLKITEQFCYNVRYTNACNQTSAFSGLSCPVYLSTLGYQQGNIRLNWTQYIHPANNFESYILEKLDETGTTYDEIPLTNLTSTYLDEDALVDRQVMRYRIKVVIDATNNIFSYSNLIEVKQKFKLFFPNAFVPNGVNNVFLPKGLFIKRFKMVIYDRLGEVLFTSQNIEQGWDGKYKGSEAMNGTYIYVVEAEDNLGEKFETQGTFVLIR
ncbi:MAG: hypothetical protein EAZ85_07980 [Bacteroidetes bacterium]|nr:MAG: hypothetical protein EAZ85_07980 [Bacteroidota bacterium]TAG87507.1 MAG: hypothetical protein EAZ20_10460 [Bacteroidota bacterium]